MSDYKDRMEQSEVEETHTTREEIEEILYAPNLNITQGEYRTFIDEVVPKIVSTFHHQLQKAKEEAYQKGRESRQSEIDFLREEAYGEGIDHSELDQDSSNTN